MNTLILLRPLRYLDPGTGSFLIQMLLAGLLGGAVAVRIYWKKITAFIKRKQNKDFDNDPTALPDDEENE